MYRIIGPDVKIHYALTRDLAYEVARNLKERKLTPYTEITLLDERRSNEYRWDPGGSLWVKDVEIRFELPRSLFVYVYGQHWEAFKQMLKGAEKKFEKYGSKFYKIHSHYHVLCLDKEQFLALKKTAKKQQFQYDQVFETSDTKRRELLAQISRSSNYLYVDPAEILGVPSNDENIKINNTGSVDE